ncbi:MAG: polysaccharide biosynthesis C-terminal domain-containing protein [Pseudomonadota bacterium]
MAGVDQIAVRAASVMVGARLLNVALGLLTIPALISFLGGEGFAAWAVLLAMAAGFSLLEVGMPSTVVRFLAVPMRDGHWDAGRAVIAQVWLVLGTIFGAGGLLIFLFANQVSRWLGLPTMNGASPAVAIWLIYCCVWARAMLQVGTLSLVAQRRFGAVSAVSLAQAAASNVVAVIAAVATRRLDVTLIAYWGCQLAVVGWVFVVTRRVCTPLFSVRTLEFARLVELVRFGVANQMDAVAQFVNFQFDKFVVAGVMGLWGVAPYEVANRAVAALRSIPASGAETFLPTAMVHGDDPDRAWEWYESSTRLVAYGACIFLLAPLSISPLFLYAWTGEMGHVGGGVFAALCIGTVATVIALPAAALAQAGGATGLQNRAAVYSMLLNVVFSLGLVLQWGLVGAAIGTCIAMTSGALLLIRAVHLRLGRPLRKTLALLAHFWPLVVVSLLWGAVSYEIYDTWIAPLERSVRFSRATRLWPGIWALGIGALCVGTMLAVELSRGRVGKRDLDFFARIVGRRRSGSAGSKVL